MQFGPGASIWPLTYTCTILYISAISFASIMSFLPYKVSIVTGKIVIIIIIIDAFIDVEN